jgi:hypothetical protein
MDTSEHQPLPRSFDPSPKGWQRTKLEHSPVWIMAHEPGKCAAQTCTLHNRTDHGMRAFMQHWREDRGLMERICPHGVGHPDPDQWDYLVMTYGKRAAKVEFVHGCCHERCCRTVNDSQDLRAE